MKHIPQMVMNTMVESRKNHLKQTQEQPRLRVTFSRSSSLVSISPFASLILQWTPSTCRCISYVFQSWKKRKRTDHPVTPQIFFSMDSKYAGLEEVFPCFRGIYVRFNHVPFRKPNPAHAPRKTSMEPESEALEEEIPFGNLSFSGSMLIFVGEYCW